MSMVLESVDRSQRFPLNRESTFIGSSEWKSDICLAEPDIADVHCELTREAQCVRVVALTEGGITVNGTSVREGTLSTGDELGIASLRFRVTIDDGHDHSRTGDDTTVELSEPGSTPESARWVVRVSGMTLGPLDWDELQSMIARGELRLDDEAQRQNDSVWQRIRDVLPRSGGEGVLCDEVPADDSTSSPVRSTHRPSPSKTAHTRNDASSRSPDDSDAGVVATSDVTPREVPLAPQFFIMRGAEEIGPLPRQAIQELADEGSIHADTPVRLEESTDWTTARAVGFRVRTIQPDEASPQPVTDPQLNSRGGLLWLLFAPYYFVTALARTIAGIDRSRVAIGAAVAILTASIAFGWFRSWSQTALRGTVTLDGQPVSDALVELTGTRTGDSAMGTTGSDGRFRLVTLDGELEPGKYLITLRPLSELSGVPLLTTAEGSITPAGDPLPERYRHINTTDAAIDIAAGQTTCSIVLTTQPAPDAAGFPGRTDLPSSPRD